MRAKDLVWENHGRWIEAQEGLKMVWKALLSSPLNPNLHKAKAHHWRVLIQLLEEAKIFLGDNNTKYSYRSIQVKRNKNSIYKIIDENDEMKRGEVVDIKTYKYFEQFLAPWLASSRTFRLGYGSPSL